MFYEVVEITENAWGVDEIIRGRFDLLSEARAYIEANYEENYEDIYIQNAWGEVVDF